MSKILKKIAKKYKWLRFLNYKTTKLAVLSAALFGLCLSSGHSFAKYRDENYGNGAAAAARFGITVEPVAETISLANANVGKYVFTANFKVSFKETEVKCSYNLKIKIGSNRDGTWNNPGSVNRTLFTTNTETKNINTLKRNDTGAYDLVSNNAGDLTAVHTALGVGASVTFGNTPYVGFSEDGSSYSWLPATITDSNLNITENKEGNVGDVHYYKVLYYTDVYKGDDNKIAVESIAFFYNILLNQVGE